jgi:hypothetical protein
MHKYLAVSNVSSKADFILRPFEDYLEQFRQSLISQNFANVTIGLHICGLHVLSKTMKPEGIPLEELDG